MPEIVSKGTFAIRRGVMPSAVSNWIKRGQLFGPALTPDGKIVVGEALRQLGAMVDPGRGAPAPASTLSLSAPAPAPASAALASETADTLPALRARKMALDIEAQERAAKIARGELVSAGDAKRRWGAELEELLSAIEQFVVADLPPKLGLGRESAAIIRQEWRRFRERRAEQAAAAREDDDDAP